MNSVIWMAYVGLVVTSQPSVKEPAPRSILNDASRIGRCQDERQGYWCDRTLLAIGDVQTRAGDFDGALQTIEASKYEYGRNSALVDLANALARSGQPGRAFAVLRRLGTKHGWRQELLEDDVKMSCLQHELSVGDRDKARKTIDEMTTAASRAGGFRRLASAYAAIGDDDAARRGFQIAVTISKTIPDEFARAKALWEIADAQLARGKSPAAGTIRELVDVSSSFKDPWARVTALREAAVRAGKMEDRQTADRLFRQAIDAREAIRPPWPCPEENRIGALEQIAKAQADVGYFEDALKTARMIPHSDQDFTVDGHREHALCAIAVGQAKAGRVADAVANALSIQYYVQYKDEALLGIAEFQLSRGDLNGAAATAGQVPDQSTKAIALLKVAAAFAKSGDKGTAKSMAGRIRVVIQPLLPVESPVVFDYRRPETWGCLYDEWRGSFTMASHHWAVGKGQQLAGAAMTFAQVLGEGHHERYAEILKGLREPEVVRAIARAHAANGDAREALAWASRIGSDEKLASSDDVDATVRVEQRISALTGVAEGILDRHVGGNNHDGQRK